AGGKPAAQGLELREAPGAPARGDVGGHALAHIGQLEQFLRRQPVERTRDAPDRLGRALIRSDAEGVGALELEEDRHFGKQGGDLGVGHGAPERSKASQARTWPWSAARRYQPSAACSSLAA